MQRDPRDQVWCVYGKNVLNSVSFGDLVLDSCCKDQRKDQHTHTDHAVCSMFIHENHGS